MRQIWSLALACLTTKYKIILNSYNLFYIKISEVQQRLMSILMLKKEENGILK